jgi:hypothetical protein
MRKTAKKTQVETCDKLTLAANTEDLKLENHNKYKNQNSLRSAPTTDFSKNVT